MASVSVISNSSCGGGQAVAAQAFRDVIDQPVVQNLARREIDREAKGNPRVVPGAELGCRFLDDPAACFQDQPCFFQQRDELDGGQHAALGMAPAQQGFGADDPARLELELGW